MCSFHCKVTVTYFKRLLAIYNDERQKMMMPVATIIERRISKHKKDAPLIFVPVYVCWFLSFHATDSLKQYLKMKLNTLVTKYTYILIFHFAHIIYPQWCIMPHELL